jgi:hypothetical protein
MCATSQHSSEMARSFDSIRAGNPRSRVVKSEIPRISCTVAWENLAPPLCTVPFTPYLVLDFLVAAADAHNTLGTKWHIKINIKCGGVGGGSPN